MISPQVPSAAQVTVGGPAEVSFQPVLQAPVHSSELAQPSENVAQPLSSGLSSHTAGNNRVGSSGEHDTACKSHLGVSGWDLAKLIAAGAQQGLSCMHVLRYSE
jgi:hypothetical protein